MSDSTQIAFQLDRPSLHAVDRLAAARKASRASVIRDAVHEHLARADQEEIDRALATGYGEVPPGPEDEVWGEISVEGLAGADLDW